MECHALNLRVVYVDHCVNVSGFPLRPRDWTGTKVPHPRRDPSGDGRWLHQAYVPRGHDPPISEEELLRRNRELGDRLRGDAEETVRKGLCSGHGLYTRPMPWKAPPAGHTVIDPVCHCFPGWFGDTCELHDGPSDPIERASKQSCVHGCRGRGVCRLNFCHCVPGTWGVDCSSGTPDVALTTMVMLQAEAQKLQQGVWTITSWSSDMIHSTWLPSRVVSRARAVVSPRIYVYELPPNFNIWLAAHFRRPGRWDQSYLYSLDLKIHRCASS
eukprot:scaffold49897_cov32-Tisochrysis_lutea.AAC.2